MPFKLTVSGPATSPAKSAGCDSSLLHGADLIAWAGGCWALQCSIWKGCTSESLLSQDLCKLNRPAPWLSWVLTGTERHPLDSAPFLDVQRGISGTHLHWGKCQLVTPLPKFNSFLPLAWRTAFPPWKILMASDIFLFGHQNEIKTYEVFQGIRKERPSQIS